MTASNCVRSGPRRQVGWFSRTNPLRTQRHPGTGEVCDLAPQADSYASVGAVASIRPDDPVIQMGKEVNLSITDERLRPTADGVFRLQYDPQVLEFRTLLNGEIVQSEGIDGQASSSSETQAGTVAFKVAPSVRQAGGRTVTATFYAKAPGVSPVRVVLVGSAEESSTVTYQEGKGIVRVR